MTAYPQDAQQTISTFCAEGIKLSVFFDYIPTHSELLCGAALPSMYHTHAFFECFYARQKTLQVHFEYETVSLLPGDLIIIPPNVLHYAVFSQTPQLPTDHFSCSFLFSSDHNAESPRSIPWAQLLKTRHYIHIPSNPECQFLIRMLADAIAEKLDHAAGAYLFSLLTKVADLLAHPIQVQTDLAIDSDSHRIFKLDSMLKQYFNSNLTLFRIAEELHMSVRQVSRLIQKQYGCTFQAKIAELRINLAKEWIKQGKTSQEIAREVGYASAEAFSNAFKKHTGLTPREYRMAAE